MEWRDGCKKIFSEVFMLHSSLLASAKWYPILFDSPTNALRSTAIWLTIALIIVFVACACALKGDKKTKFMRIALIAAIFYACALCIAFLSLTFAEDGVKAILFVPLLILVVSIAGSALVLVFKRKKLVYILTGCTTGASFVATLVCMGVYYASGESEKFNEATIMVSENIALYICAVGLIAIILSLAFFLNRKEKKGFDTKSISYAAICIAMSFALSYLRIVKMPQGGSITAASLLPLIVYSYMFGTKKGVFAGFIYGILQAIQDPFIIHPAQFLLDYPIAFSAIGLAGIFAQTKQLEKFPQVQFTLGAIVASALRFTCHVLSGVFAFSEYSTLDNLWAYSLGYNSFIFIDIAVVIAVGVIVFSSRSFVKQARKFHSKKIETESADTQKTAQN